MVKIGLFEKGESAYVGSIKTLSMSVADVRIVPEANRHADNSPSHRIFHGDAMIGAAWPKQTIDGRPFLNCKVDDPCLAHPLYATLHQDGETSSFSLLWTRPRANDRAVESD